MTRLELHADRVVVGYGWGAGMQDGVLIERHPNDGDQVLIIGTPSALRELADAIHAQVDDM